MAHLATKDQVNADNDLFAHFFGDCGERPAPQPCPIPFRSVRRRHPALPPLPPRQTASLSAALSG